MPTLAILCMSSRFAKLDLLSRGRPSLDLEERCSSVKYSVL